MVQVVNGSKYWTYRNDALTRQFSGNVLELVHATDFANLLWAQIQDSHQLETPNKFHQEFTDLQRSIVSLAGQLESEEELESDLFNSKANRIEREFNRINDNLEFSNDDDK